MLDETNSDLWARLKAADPGPGNKNLRVDTLALTYLADGPATMGQLITALKHFDLERTHIAGRVSKGAGLNPDSSLWRKVGRDTYALFDPDQPAAAPIPAAGIAVPTTRSAEGD